MCTSCHEKCIQAQTGQHASFFHGKSPVHKSGDTYTKIYYFIMPENCEKQKQNKKSLPGCHWYKEQCIKMNFSNRIWTENHLHLHHLEM